MHYSALQCIALHHIVVNLCRLGVEGGPGRSDALRHLGNKATRHHTEKGPADLPTRQDFTFPADRQPPTANRQLASASTSASATPQVHTPQLHLLQLLPRLLPLLLFLHDNDILTMFEVCPLAFLLSSSISILLTLTATCCRPIPPAHAPRPIRRPHFR